MTIYQITGEDLAYLLRQMGVEQPPDAFAYNAPYSLRIEPRANGVACKINARTWTPTIGRVEEQ